MIHGMYAIHYSWIQVTVSLPCWFTAFSSETQTLNKIYKKFNCHCIKGP